MSLSTEPPHAPPPDDSPEVVFVGGEAASEVQLVGEAAPAPSSSPDDVVFISGAAPPPPIGAVPWPSRCPHCTSPLSGPECGVCGLPFAQQDEGGGGRGTRPALLFDDPSLAELVEDEHSVIRDIHTALRAAAGGISARCASRRPVWALCAMPYAFYSQAEQGPVCGWRSLQMLLSAIMGGGSTALRSTLFDGSGTVPTVPALQACLEAAWAEGFDPEGALHFGGRVLRSKRYIGGGEVATILRFFGVDARAEAFHSWDDPNVDELLAHDPHKRERVRDARAAAERAVGGGGGGGSRHPAAERKYLYSRHSALIKWLQSHFGVTMQCAAMLPPGPSEAGAGAGAGAPPRGPTAFPMPTGGAAPFPAYLQHDGHARVLAGFEVRLADDAPGGKGPSDPFIQRVPGGPVQQVLSFAPAQQSGLGGGSGAGVKRPREDGGDGLGGGGIGDIDPQLLISLLILDPATPAPILKSALTSTSWPALIKRGFHTLRQSHFEVIVVPRDARIVPRGAARDALKTFTVRRHYAGDE